MGFPDVYFFMFLQRSTLTRRSEKYQKSKITPDSYQIKFKLTLHFLHTTSDLPKHIKYQVKEADIPNNSIHI